jgi:diguanylate cyclase (GGDEF)-like protein/PAS domain S-box-containing protein
VEIDPWRVLLRYSRDVAYVADRDGCLTWVSESLPRVLGWQVPDLVGRSLRELVHPDDRDAANAWRELLAARQTDEGLRTDPLRFRRADSSYVWCAVSAARAFADDGTLAGITGSLHDVDDLVRARIAAAEAHARLHALLEAQVEPLVSLVAVRDGSGAVVDFMFEDVSQSAADFHRTSIAELTGATVLQVLGSQAGGDDVDTARRVLQTGEAVIVNDSWSFVKENQGAPPTWLDIRIVPVDDDRVSYSWRDVTDRYRARVEVARAHDLMRSVIDAQLDPYVLFRTVRDDSGAVVDVVYEDLNEAAARFEGRAREALLGVTLRAVYRNAAEATADIADCGTALATRRPVVRTDVPSFEYADDTGAPTIVDLAIVPIDEDRVSYTWRDVTDKHRAREEVRQAHGLLRRVIDSQVDPHVLLSAVRGQDGQITDFVYLDANEAAARYEGVARERMVGASIRDVYHDLEEAREDLADCIQALESGRPVVRNDARTLGYLDEAGRPIVTDNRIVPIDGDLVSYSWRDVTDRHAAQQALAESEERFRLLAENMTDIVALIRETVIVWVSPSVLRTLGWTPEELVGLSPAVFTYPEDTAEVMQRWQAVPEGDLPRQRYRMVTKDGSPRWVDAEGRIISLDPRTVIVTARIVEAEVAALRALEEMARHDELTGLVNRHAVFDQVTRTLQGDVRSGTRVGMVFCDLDGFKAVNDTYGHSAGDALLRSIARRLERAVRAVDVVARIGGDELLVVLNGVHDLDDAVAIAEKLRAEVRQPTPIPGGTVTVSASVGVAVAEPGETIDDIVARADAAMYDAKRSGKDRVVAVRGPVG